MLAGPHSAKLLARFLADPGSFTVEEQELVKESGTLFAFAAKRRLWMLSLKALKADPKFDVWYDTWSLMVGQSLLKQISNGFNNGNTASSVLSEHFFAKKWPQTELDGLFDLEPADHSLILPIWHEINKEEVSQYSPIIAGRVAAKSEWGLKRVISNLKRSIEVGERTKEISSPLGLQIRAFQDTVGAQELYKHWAWSPAGIQAVWTGWARISEIATSILNTL